MRRLDLKYHVGDGHDAQEMRITTVITCGYQAKSLVDLALLVSKEYVLIDGVLRTNPLHTMPVLMEYPAIRRCGRVRQAAQRR